ncbi:MAG: DNA polymerase I [Firmicutes bacterium HGW-Firmicutes-1]|jgi:DNA polymerase-1|nr:MAG: DNA polymerase I [Firmicutes bacterium HGW-Firmicutes-1]
MNEKVLLIDGNSIMNRAFYGIRELTNAEGLHTNAVYGFLNILFKTIDEEVATHVVVAFDLKAPTFRHVKYKAYKGNRKSMPDELREQMPLIKQVLGEMNITISEIEGYEADDIIGTLAFQSEREGRPVTILSGDRDMLQLATESIKISIPKTKNGSTTTEHYYANDVKELYHVTPKEFIDIKGLMGDSSDNIPGIPGIGEKTAIKIIEDYHCIENAYKNLESLPSKIASKLSEHIDIALLSKELATICTDCATNIVFDECKLNNLYSEAVYNTFKRLEFKSFLDRFQFDAPKKQVINYSISEINHFDKLKEQLYLSKKLAYYLVYDCDRLYLSFTSDGDHHYYCDSTIIKKEFICEALIHILLDENIIKITHSLNEQLHLLEIQLATSNRSIYDLALVSYLMNPVKETYHIDDIAKDILDVVMVSLDELVGKGKSKIPLSELPREALIDYSVQSTNILFNSYIKLFDKLKEENMLDLYFNIELPLLYVLKSMETIGVKVDSKGLKEYGNNLYSQIVELEKNIYEMAGESFNINSPKQLGVILFEKLQLPSNKKTKTSYSTAADVLEKLQNKHPIIREVLAYRQLTKLKSTYADGLFEYIKEDGRIHSTFNQKVTSTGRISSTEPNLQNIPIKLEIGRAIRKVFIPEEGCVFIDADYSQIELRLLAHLSKDESFIEAFNRNLDIHTMTASQVFYVPFEEVTDLQRRNAKAVNFGIVYGISAFGLSEDLNISRKEAADYIEQYFAKYPSVKSFLDQTVEDAKKTGYVKTMFNRLRTIPELSSSNFMQRSFGERIAMNTPIQGSAADIIKIAMINVYNSLMKKGLKSRLILQVHDELLIESPVDEAEQVKEILISEMEKAVILKVPLTVDAHIGNNWYEAK